MGSGKSEVLENLKQLAEHDSKSSSIQEAFRKNLKYKGCKNRKIYVKDFPARNLCVARSCCIFDTVNK